MSNLPAQITATVNRSPFAVAQAAVEIALRMAEPRTTIPINIEPTDMVKLAREIAMDIRELADILATYKLTGEQYARISTLPFFKSALQSAIIEWTSALNTHERIKIEAATSLEDALPVLAGRMKDKNETLPAAVETGKLFAKIAGLGEREQAQHAPGERFTININLGDGQDIHFEKDITPKAASGSTGAIQIDTEGAGL